MVFYLFYVVQFGCLPWLYKLYVACIKHCVLQYFAQSSPLNSVCHVAHTALLYFFIFFIYIIYICLHSLDLCLLCALLYTPYITYIAIQYFSWITQTVHVIYIHTTRRVARNVESICSINWHTFASNATLHLMCDNKNWAIFQQLCASSPWDCCYSSASQRKQ